MQNLKCSLRTFQSFLSIGYAVQKLGAEFPQLTVPGVTPKFWPAHRQPSSAPCPAAKNGPWLDRAWRFL